MLGSWRGCDGCNLAHTTETEIPAHFEATRVVRAARASQPLEKNDFAVGPVQRLVGRYQAAEIVSGRGDVKRDLPFYGIRFGALRQQLLEPDIEIIVVGMVFVQKWIRSAIIVPEFHRGREIGLGRESAIE